MCQQKSDVLFMAQIRLRWRSIWTKNYLKNEVELTPKADIRTAEIHTQPSSEGTWSHGDGQQKEAWQLRNDLTTTWACTSVTGFISQSSSPLGLQAISNPFLSHCRLHVPSSSGTRGRGSHCRERLARRTLLSAPTDNRDPVSRFTPLPPLTNINYR